MNPATTTLAAESTIIICNGGKWAGQAPDPIETLYSNLATYELDPAFLSDTGAPYHEEYNNGNTSFFGNFREFSGVFRVVSNEPEVVARLLELIEANATTKQWRQDQARKRKAYLNKIAKAMLSVTDPTLEQENAGALIDLDEAPILPPSQSWIVLQLEELNPDDLSDLHRLFVK